MTQAKTVQQNAAAEDKSVRPFRINIPEEALLDLRRRIAATTGLTRDEILHNITLYWLANTGVSSARLYWANKLAFSRGAATRRRYLHPTKCNRRLIMEFRQLGGSGFKVPALCLGTGTFGGKNEFFRAFGATEVEEATKLVDISLEAGLSMFDSADVFSNGFAEEILGQAIKGRRDQVILSTKATFRSGPGENEVGSSRHHLIKACEASLRRLGTDYIDLYQLHGFDALSPVEETLSALDDMVHSGKVRYVGCSNFSGWHLMKSLAVSEKYGLCRYVAHQAYYSLVGREAQVAELDASSDKTPIYPYSHQRGFGERNPSPITRS